MDEKRAFACAYSFRNAETEGTPLPSSYTSLEEAVASLMGAVWVEAKEGLSAPISKPKHVHLLPVDMDGEAPGIVRDERGTEVVRMPLPTSLVRYKKRVPPPPIRVRARKERTQRAAEREAVRREERERKTLEKRACKREGVAGEEEERKVKAKKERTTKPRREEGEGGGEGEGNEGGEEEEGGRARKKVKREEGGEGEDACRLLNLEGAVEREGYEPQKKRGKYAYFASPVPFDRHLFALEACDPHPSLLPPLLSNTPSDALVCVRGAPGAGKTSHLVSLLPDTGRVLLCAPTNLGAANLYHRAVLAGVHAALLLPMGKVPSHVPVLSQDPACRVVCCTVSGRAGPLLDGQVFETVLVDEAGLCAEAVAFGLARKEVSLLVLAGDERQLPPLVSERGRAAGAGRSLFARLLEAGYPATTLTVQRRMHPEILSFPNRAFYAASLTTEEGSYDATEAAPYRAFQVDGAETKRGTGFVNLEEADAVAAEGERERLVEKDVVLLTPYASQVETLRTRTTLPVYTVDAFQGREAAVVLVSFVRTSGGPFLEEDGRMAVALTRAKKRLLLFGDFGCPSLHAVGADARERGCLLPPAGKGGS